MKITDKQMINAINIIIKGCKNEKRKCKNCVIDSKCDAIYSGHTFSSLEEINNEEKEKLLDL